MTWRLKRADCVQYAAAFATLLAIRVVVVVEQLSLVDYHPGFPFSAAAEFFKYGPISPFSE